jgi:protein required for attachment to host cells
MAPATSSPQSVDRRLKLRTEGDEVAMTTVLLGLPRAGNCPTGRSFRLHLFGQGNCRVKTGVLALGARVSVARAATPLAPPVALGATEPAARRGHAVCDISGPKDVRDRVPIAEARGPRRPARALMSPAAMTGQGNTWVLVADAHQGRILEVDDAGLPAKVHHTIGSRGGKAHDERGDLPEVADRPKHASTHKGALHSSGAPADEAEHQFAKELVRMLERGLAENAFHHLVLVAPPKLLGILRENLSRGLAAKLRGSEHKDYAHLSDHELELRVRELVQIWPTN